MRPLTCAALLALTACGSDFQDRSQLRELRVLALVAAPLELGPGEQVAIRPYVYVPGGGAPAAQSWTFCPFTAGASASFACAVPQCEVAVPAQPDGSVRADPLALALACLQRFAGASPPPGVPATIPERVDTVFRYRVEAGGDVREAIARIPFYPNGAPASRNLPPVILGVAVGGVAVPDDGVAPALREGGETEVRVRLDPASAQPYVDESGRSVTEALVVSYYASAGEWDADRADGPDARRTLKANGVGSAAEILVWAVARDLRGGEAIAGPFRVPIAR
jgi:hypothetical protein